VRGKPLTKEYTTTQLAFNFYNLYT
jgi:hypothetical protein